MGERKKTRKKGSLHRTAKLFMLVKQSHEKRVAANVKFTRT